MNKELLLKVADVIEKDTIGVNFDMAHFRYIGSCQTAACIAGHVVFLEDPVAFKTGIGISVEAMARNFLDFSDEDPRPSKLFFHSPATRDEAAWVIRNLVETGKVDWNHPRNKMNRLISYFKQVLGLRRNYDESQVDSILGERSTGTSRAYGDTRQRAQVWNNRHVIALEDNFNSPSIVGVEVIPTCGVVSHSVRIEDISPSVSPVLDEVN
jgi:hypothetical protein